MRLRTWTTIACGRLADPDDRGVRPDAGAIRCFWQPSGLSLCRFVHRRLRVQSLHGFWLLQRRVPFELWLWRANRPGWGGIPIGWWPLPAGLPGGQTPDDARPPATLRRHHVGPGLERPEVSSASPSHIPRRPSTPLTPPFDDNGKILWPSTIPNDPAAADSRQTAEAAVRAVVHESKSTGHASVKPVIEAKNKLSAFERKVLPEVKSKNATDGTALETFFLELDKALDAMTYVY